MLNLFLDSADIDEIRDVYSLIRLDGVTTNPSLLAKAKNKYGSPVLNLKVVYNFVIQHGGSLHVQPVGTSYEEIISDAYYILDEVGPKTWIKIPVTEPGLAAIGKLSKEGINITAASIFSFTQAMLAYKAGAKCISVYCNRAEENGIDYKTVIKSIKNAVPDVMLLAASFKDIKQVEEASFSGADSLTIKKALLFSALNDSVIKDTVRAFKDDWAEAFSTNTIKGE